MIARFIVSFLALFLAVASAASPRSRECFDYAWTFHLGDAPGAEKPDFDVSAWRSLDLPHDLSIEGPFDAKAAVGASGGYLPGGIAWYRKSFRLPKASQGRKVFIEFDGAYMNSEVWINGHHLGKRPYGYIGFEYDLTPHLDFNGDNVIAVRLDNAKLNSGRWYAGTGIYRHVWLKTIDPVHVAHWGTYITTPEITEKMAVVSIETTVSNHLPSDQNVTVTQEIVSADGRVVPGAKQVVAVKSGEKAVDKQHIGLNRPLLWSLEIPYLYTVRTTLRIGDRVCDVYESPLGIRTLRFDAKEGFFVNGVNTKMKGVCNHQDLGPLGTALWDQALERHPHLALPALARTHGAL
jgi:beta-galactosidase